MGRTTELIHHFFLGYFLSEGPFELMFEQFIMGPGPVLGLALLFQDPIAGNELVLLI